MTVIVTNKTALPPVSKGEVLRYAACPCDGEIALPKCPKIASAVCYTTLSVSVCDGVCDFGLFKIKSKQLSKNLEGCKNAVVFAATVGIDFDREIAKYTRVSPSRALLVSAMGTERVEALCDAFVNEYEENNGVKLRPRFSPGYGDLPLEAQRDIFLLLDPAKRVGITLGESLLMTPTKSVTAFAGIELGEKYGFQRIFKK